MQRKRCLPRCVGMMRMMTIAACSLAALIAAGNQTRAQQPPHDFAQDTPAPPGLIVKAPQEKHRITPKPQPFHREDMLGLPTSGPKGLRLCPASRVEQRDEVWFSPRAC